MTIYRSTFMVFVIAVALSAGCSLSTASKSTSDGSHKLNEGETFGAIQRLPGGTAVASDVITLLNMTCTSDQVIVSTNLKTITGKMDCRQAVPQATLDRFYGTAVSITYTGGRLRIESVSAGSLDLPVQDATSKDVNATP